MELIFAGTDSAFTGSINKAGNTLSVSARLIDISSAKILRMFNDDYNDNMCPPPEEYIERGDDNAR